MAAPNDHAASISEAEADIEQTSDDLGRTVDALKDKFDVKAQAKHKVDDVKESAAAQVHNVQKHAAHVAADVKDAATDDHGKPKPAVPIGGAIAAAAAVVLVWLWRRR